MTYPFLGLGFNSWTQKFSRGGPAVIQAFLEYLTTSNTSSFTLLSTGTVDYEVDWGDGTIESLTTNNPTHTYSSAGEYTIKVTPAEGSTYSPYFNNAVSDTSIASVSGTGGSQLGTILSRAWYGATNMTSFSSDIDTSSGNDFIFTWRSCSSLTSFPLLNTSSGTSFSSAWRNCSALVTFPANMFDTTGTLASIAFRSCWNSCALSAQSIENILTSLDTNGQTGVTLGIDGGSNAAKTTWSTSANDAYDNLIAKGWTISYNA